MPLPTWVDEEAQGEHPRQRRRLRLISHPTRVLGADTEVHADVAEDELRVVGDDRHTWFFGEVQPSDDDDETESLRDGDSVVGEFDSAREDVFVPEVDARAPRVGVGRSLGSSAVFGRHGLGHNSLDQSVRRAEHSSFLAGPVPHLHTVRQRSYPTHQRVESVAAVASYALLQL